MNLLEMCTSQSWGGMEMQTLKISVSFKELGHSLTLLCFPGSSLDQEARKAGINTITIPFKNGLHLLLILKLRKYLKQNQFDLIHTHFSRDLRFFVPASISLRNNPPIVLTKHVGSYINKKDLFHKYLYFRVDLITAISKVIKQNVIDTCPVELSKVEIFYSGIDVDKFQSALTHRDKKRKEFGIKDEIITGIFGRFSPGKGHEEFLQAAKIISEKRNNVKFLIVGSESHGEGDYAESIYKLAKELKLNNNVIFTGYRKDVPELLSMIDILAVPSHAEAFGIVAIEGMAAGKPVAASNTDGLPDIVLDGETGIQFPPKNSEALAESLLRLIDNKELREKFGNAGLQRAKEIFDEKVQMNKLEKRFLDLIEMKKNDKS